MDLLENYSLKSSEDVNEGIEGLTNCINNNAGALKKSMTELAVLKK